MPCHVSKAEFEELVEQALADLPEPFARVLEEVPVEVRPRSSSAQRRKMGLDANSRLMGLYHGIPRTKRSVEHSGVMPDVIYVFQEDIELACENKEQLVEEVRKTVLHEIGHHFGMSEEDLDELGYG
jgi:predicted Zn-dependent protease with MMP-like domain